MAFNADDPAEFLDLVQELRATESSAYTESETPIFTCISVSLERALDALDGERCGRRVAAGPSRTRSRAASSSSSVLVSFTRGRRAVRRPPSRRVDRLPALVGHVFGLRSASSSSSASRLGSAGSLQAARVEVGQQLRRPSPGRRACWCR